MATKITWITFGDATYSGPIAIGAPASGKINVYDPSKYATAQVPANTTLPAGVIVLPNNPTLNIKNGVILNPTTKQPYSSSTPTTTTTLPVTTTTRPVTTTTRPVTTTTQAATSGLTYNSTTKTYTYTNPVTGATGTGSTAASAQFSSTQRQSSGRSINYPTNPKVIYNALVASGADKAAAQTLSKTLAGKPIQTSSSILDQNGKVSSSGAYDLMTSVLLQGGPALAQAVFGQIPGFNVSQWLSGTKGQAPLLKGLVEALNVGINPQVGGDLSKLPQGVNYGPGLSAAAQQQRTILNEAVNIAGQQVQAYTSAQKSASTQISAYESLYNKLDSLNLSAVAPQVQQWVFGKNITNGNELMQLVRNTPQYKSEFSGLVGPDGQWAQAAKNGTKPMTELEYLNLTSSYKATADSAGLPPGFLTKVEMANLVKGDVSAAEFSRRVAYGYNAVAALPQNIQQQFMQEHNVGPGGLVAYFLDPKRGEAAVTRQALSANLQSTAQAAGLQQFSSDQAAQLGEMVRVAGVTGAASDPYSQFTLGKAQQALQTAARDVSLTKAAPGAAAPTVDTNTLIGSQIAGFGGTSQPAAQQAVSRAEQAAVAPFEKGGGYSETAKGVTGLGAART